MIYPMGIGLTGAVIKSKGKNYVILTCLEVLVINNVQRETRYNPSTDNISSSIGGEPFNMMLCPIVDWDGEFDTLGQAAL